MKVSNTSIARAWRAYGIKPWKAESFRFSTDPELVGKVTDICGLYLGTNEDIPANAIVLSVDEEHVAMIARHDGVRVGTKAEGHC